MSVRFLLDENLSPRLSPALWRYNPTIDVLRVGDPGAPPLGTLDPDLLVYLEQEQRAGDEQPGQHARASAGPCRRWRASLGHLLAATGGGSGGDRGRAGADLGGQHRRRVARPDALAPAVRGVDLLYERATMGRRQLDSRLQILCHHLTRFAQHRHTDRRGSVEVTHAR